METQTQTTSEKMGVEPKKTNIGWIILSGFLQLILGLFLVFSPGITTFRLIQFLGIYWFVMGIVSIIQIFTSKRKEVHWGWLLFSGILGIIAGILVWQNPFFSAVFGLGFIFYFIIFTGLFHGFVRIAQGFQGAGFWNIVLGILLVLVSLYLMFNPFGAIISMPIIIGIFLIIGGIAVIFAGIWKGDEAYNT